MHIIAVYIADSWNRTLRDRGKAGTRDRNRPPRGPGLIGTGLRGDWGE